MADPTRIYQGQLPLFPEVYQLAVHFRDPSIPAIVWDSPVPRPRQQRQVRRLDHPVYDGAELIGWIRCEYRLHAFAKARRDEEERARVQWIVGALVVTAGVVALAWVATFLTRECRRERRRVMAEREKEHAERLLLENQLRRARGTAGKGGTGPPAARAKPGNSQARGPGLRRGAGRAGAEVAALRQHRHHGRLVRRTTSRTCWSGPTTCCAAAWRPTACRREQEQMLREVRQTLGTVTERLQQILRTVRRDPSRTELTRLDLNALVRDSQRTWADLAPREVEAGR